MVGHSDVFGFFAMEPFDAVYHRGGPALSTPMSLQRVQPLADILQVQRTGICPFD